MGLHSWSPGSEDSLVLGNIAAMGGAWSGVLLFDQVIDSV